jgi:hypothetical protein
MIILIFGIAFLFSNYTSTYISLQIVQNTNKEYSADIDYTVVYNPNIKK